MLDELKDYLNITWDEEDPVLERIINRGKDYLQSKTSTELSFEDDLTVQQLLLDYCRYVRNNSFELFGINFKREILALSLREAVKDREDNEKNAGSNP